MLSRFRLTLCTVTFLSVLLCTPLVPGEVSLPHLFSDHAVLQRNRPIHIWGWATPREKLTISFHQQTASAIADDLGCWNAWLKPESAGGPFELTVTGSTSVTIHDLLVGDVWVASGQSNMGMPLKGYAASSPVTHGQEAIASAMLPQLRLLNINRKSDSVPQTDFDAIWTTSSPQTAQDFSAVAYFFGRELNQREHVPIGLIEAAWGGTPLEAWMSLDGLAQDASLMPVFAARASFEDEQVRMDRLLAEEKSQDAANIKSQLPVPPHPWHADNEGWIPGALYNGMIAPVAGYAIKGVIWYQGESNTAPDRSSLYARLMPALIANWRAKWKQGDFPFLFVQLSSFKSVDDWGAIRDAQRRSLAVVNTGMAVTLDIGAAGNIHPPDKTTVATRLSLAARALAYGEPIEYSGPLFRQATPNGDSIRVWFDHADGLHAKSNQVDGFEIAGADGIFVPALATIEQDTVVVRSNTVPQPRRVRYGWAGFTPANLYNKSDLPAAAFASE